MPPSFWRPTRRSSAAGFEHYEVSNAARPGHRARHNSAYWRRAPFIGLGPSAHSGFGRERRWNVRDWAAYERAIAAGEARRWRAGSCWTDAAIALEELYLGLRTSEGPAQRPGSTRQSGPGWEQAGWAELHGGPDPAHAGRLAPAGRAGGRHRA